MPLTIDAEDLEFARRVDALGLEGLTQAQIASRLGLTRDQVRHRLAKANCEWSVESRVRYSPLGSQRIADLIDKGELQPAAAD